MECGVRWGRRLLEAAAGGLLVAMTACAPPAPKPATLELMSFRQAGVDGVLLNESLLWLFDRELDRMSVTRESVRIEDSDGVPARGRLWVEGRRLQFLPELPRAPGLGDGSFRPGAVYQVALAGFPRPDALRARDGAPLSRSASSSFRVAAAGRGTRVFEDPELGPPLPLELVRGRISADEPIELRLGEPVDPASIFADDFELSSVAPGPDGRLAVTRLPLAVVLAENRQDGARLELRPSRGGAFPPDTYHLWIDPERARLADLSGQPFPVRWQRNTGRAAEIAVRAPELGQPAGRLVEDFTGPEALSAQPAPGSDGTLTVRNGVLSYLWPRAAGHGGDGPVVLGEHLGSTDVHATSLQLPAGVRLELPAEGLVVLRAQGKLEIDGILRRRGESGARSFAEGETPLEWLARLRGAHLLEPSAPLEAAPLETLSAFLARAAEERRPWTVLVAGGDLVVRGDLWVDGGLVLVAGGWIRASGAVTARQIWKSERGGGVEMRPEPVTLPLVIDEPEHHRLAAPLTLGALTAPLLPPGGLDRWRGAEASVQGPGVRLRYLGERDPSAGAGDAASPGPFDDPTRLPPHSAVRVWVEVTVEPGDAGAPWRRSYVDRVELLFDPVPERPGSGDGR